jgi:hypothetical protein
MFDCREFAKRVRIVGLHTYSCACKHRVLAIIICWHTVLSSGTRGTSGVPGAVLAGKTCELQGMRAGCEIGLM